MKYYSEDDMKNHRLALEQSLLRWPLVTMKRMFGCPCYVAKGKLFAFLVSNGIVITKLSPDQRDRMKSEFQTTSFRAKEKSVEKWIKVSLKEENDLPKIIPFVEMSYNNALAE